MKLKYLLIVPILLSLSFCYTSKVIAQGTTSYDFEVQGESQIFQWLSYYYSIGILNSNVNLQGTTFTWSVSGGYITSGSNVTSSVNTQVSITWTNPNSGSITIVSTDGNFTYTCKPFNVSRAIVGPTLINQPNQWATYTATSSLTNYISYNNNNGVSSSEEIYVSWIVNGGEVINNYDGSISVRWYSFPGQITAHIQVYTYFEDDNTDPPTYSSIIESDVTGGIPIYQSPTALSNTIASSTGNTSFSNVQIPDQIIETSPTSNQSTSTQPVYQWESSLTPLDGFTDITTATNSNYIFNTQISQTTYFRRKIIGPDGVISYSNTVKYALVSKNWENMNFIKIHDINKVGIADFNGVDNLSIGDKLQTNTYYDGFGRQIQKVYRETSFNGDGNPWKDFVNVYKYDQYGRQANNYLSYSTSQNIGLFKSTGISDQSSYYSNSNTFNDSHPFTTTSFENNPLSRPINIKSPGDPWNTSSANGLTFNYQLNDNNEIIPILFFDNSNNVLINTNLNYATNTNTNSLFKTITTDENGKKIIEYKDNDGKLILIKVQLFNNPSGMYTGWACTFNIYDDYGRLRYQLQPEAVKWLENNNWDFDYTNSSFNSILSEQSFYYEYDKRGRTIVKKAPGAEKLYMVYDIRDRLVLTQDGNQRAKYSGTGYTEWTVNLYDELDRVTLTTLYKTNNDFITLQTTLDQPLQTSNSSTSVVVLGNTLTDLIIDNRPNTNINLYAASNSVQLVSDKGGDFETLPNDELVVEIDPNATANGTTNTISTNNTLPIDFTLNNSSVCTILKYFFYDNYSYNGSKAFETNVKNTDAYPASTANILLIANSNRTELMLTGTAVRVLGTQQFLISTLYYDDNGRLLQASSDNISNGVDISTNQYHFDGKLMSSYTSHTMPFTAYLNFGILSKFNYDNIGRLLETYKRFGNNSIFVKTSTLLYDDLGRISKKTLDPDYNSSAGLETLNYSYNIQGNLTGINKNYALKDASANYSKWDYHFGMYIGYADDGASLFNNYRLDGKIAGVIWNTQGDEVQRKFDYSYDNLNRLIKADFTQKNTPSDQWNISTLDYSVGGNATTDNSLGGTLSNTIGYDLNGNIQSMYQVGTIFGQAGSTKIDDLSYTYQTLSNKLAKVTDNSPLSSSNNGILGDFKDGTNTSDDYQYDDNGNLIVDLNKNIQSLNSGKGINYNYLDKPELIQINGKSTIQIVYDADGNKLQKIYTPTSTGFSGSKITTYVSGFIYESSTISDANNSSPPVPNDLQFINFEEGRVRIITSNTSSPTGIPLLDYINIDGSSNISLPSSASKVAQKGVFDYFIKDNLGNIRMVLTEEVHEGKATCTFELPRNEFESPIFGDAYLQNGAITNSSSIGWTTNSSTTISKLSAITKKVGANTLLKVMAGDVLSSQVDYYYKNNTTITGNESALTDILASLTTALSSGIKTVGLIKPNPSINPVNINTSPIIPSNPTSPTGQSLPPKAYLTMIFFDERFQYVEANIERVQQAGTGEAPLKLSNIKAPKNGYVFIYISNESNEPVYFDNLQITHDRGRLIEENHYYAFGLKIAGISSRKLGDANEGALKNQYQYQGDYSEFDDETGWNEFDLRDYDPQIGRFIQADPFDQFPSQYTGMGNNPISFADPSGGFSINFGSISTLGRIGVTAGGAAVGFAIDKLTGGNGWTGAAIGGAVALGATFIPPFDIGAIGGALKEATPSLAIQGANIALNVVTNPYARFAGGGETVNERIARLAQEKVDAKLDDWNFNKAKDDIPARKDKCNKFVYDVITEAGASAPTTWFRNPFHWYPIRAGQWADPNYYVPNWRVLSKTEIPQPGDVVAEGIQYTNGASGHVGIVVKFGQTASQESDPKEQLGISNFGFRADGDKSHGGTGHYRNATFRRYTPPPPVRIDPITPGNGGIM